MLALSLRPEYLTLRVLPPHIHCPLGLPTSQGPYKHVAQTPQGLEHRSLHLSQVGLLAFSDMT